MEQISPNEQEKSQRSLSVKGEAFYYLKDRLIGGQVFANSEKSKYLRVANPEEIAGEVNLTQDLYQRGFPVPQVKATGTLEDGTAYYVENSIGEEVFGDIFKRETEESGHVSDASFDLFLTIIKRYARAQFDSKNFVPRDKESLAAVTALANVLRNNPPFPERQEKFQEAYQRASERVLELPWGYLQSDLNAFNILEDGIIDFELAGFGPVGYDIFTNIHFGRMWPKDRVAYIFTDEQVAKYLEEIDELSQEAGLPPISSFSEDFLVLKAIWATGKDKESEDHPERHAEFWKWRVKIRDWSIDQYLEGKKIDPVNFEEVGGQADTRT